MPMKLDLGSICKTIERQQCRVHHTHPIAKVSGNAIRILACCNKFQEELMNLQDNLISAQLGRSIDDTFGSISSGRI